VAGSRQGVLVRVSLVVFEVSCWFVGLVRNYYMFVELGLAVGGNDD
jgi:hypothetical protein